MEVSNSRLRSAAANWWVYVVGGLGLFLLGLFAFSYPASAFLSLTVYFAAAILFNGVGNILFAVSNRTRLAGWVGLLVLGLAEVALGIYLFAAPGVAAGTLAYFIGFWLLLRSASLIGKSFTLRRLGFRNWGWTLALGLLGIVLAFLVLVNPAIGALGATVWLAVALVVLGSALFILGLRLRSAAPQAG
ncbi:MAG: hypothetical protein EOO36_12410 [Cytophagaceae bacterium]|nr:MAG: hypothetical protein EOO36_12410 [Cytophagaceae bacterium]